MRPAEELLRRFNGSQKDAVMTFDCLVLQIFFDDNVGHGAAHIVDARHAVTGASLPFQVFICTLFAPPYICARPCSGAQTAAATLCVAVARVIAVSPAATLHAVLC